MTLPGRTSVLAHAFALTAFACLVVPLAAQSPAPAKPAALVDPAILQPLLPSPDGWKVVRQKSDKILTPDCSYSFAEVLLSKDEMNVRVTVADTGEATDSLLTLATMVVTLPEDFTGDVPPATTIRRLTVDGMQAAERWSASDKDGEFSLVIGNRFVVKAEGTKLDAVETLRKMVETVDLKKVAALK